MCSTTKMEADGESVTAPSGGALPSSPVTCPLEQSTMQYSSWVGETSIQPNRQDLSKRCLPFFPSQPAPCQQIRICQNLLWLSKHDMRGGFLTNPPTRSKSKCAIKNAHLCSSSRLSNAYASYPRDQVKWYHKWYRISFIRDTIHIASVGCWGVVGWGVFSLCYHTVWTLGKWETEKALVERHPSGCCLDSRLLNAAVSFPLSTQNVKISWDESAEKHDATQEIHRVTDNLRADTGPGITADVNCWK